MKLRVALVLLLSIGMVTPALAQQPLRIVIGFPPGGSVDTVSRLLGEQLRQSLARPVLVENRPGAIAAIAAEATKNSAPDGSTLLLNVVGSMIVAPNARKSNTFDTLRDFAPVSLVTTSHLALAVAPGVPAKNLREYLDWAKANRGKIGRASCRERV